MLAIDLKQYFMAARIAHAIETAPPIKTTVMDKLFPESVRRQYDSPVIPISEIRTMVDCVPVVMRGAASVPLTGVTLDNVYIEPLSVRVHSPIKPVEMNNLKLMGMGDKDAWAQRKILSIRGAIRATCEVLCAQAIFNGAISYPLLQANGTFAEYTVSYGGSIVTDSVAAGDKWDHANATMSSVYLFLEAMDSAQDAAGYGGDKVVYAGKLAYAKLLELIEATDKPKIPVRINEDGTITLGGHTIKKMAETWKDPNTGGSTAKVPDKEIRMVSKGYTGLIYGPVDDLDANLRPMPMFVKPVKLDDPSELRIIGESKPLPAVVPAATRRAIVLT